MTDKKIVLPTDINAAQEQVRRLHAVDQARKEQQETLQILRHLARHAELQTQLLQQQSQLLVVIAEAHGVQVKVQAAGGKQSGGSSD